MTVLIDSNVLIYSQAKNEPRKRRVANEVMKKLASTDNGVLTAQVLAEFSNVCIRKLNLPVAYVEEQVGLLSKSFPVLPLTEWVVLGALQAVKDHKLSYYDAQIWATANSNRVPYLISEDFSPGTSLGGVMFIDPFQDGFSTTALG